MGPIGAPLGPLGPHGPPLLCRRARSAVYACLKYTRCWMSSNLAPWTLCRLFFFVMNFAKELKPCVQQQQTATEQEYNALRASPAAQRGPTWGPQGPHEPPRGIFGPFGAPRAPPGAPGDSGEAPGAPRRLREHFWKNPDFGLPAASRHGAKYLTAKSPLRALRPPGTHPGTSALKS